MSVMAVGIDVTESFSMASRRRIRIASGPLRGNRYDPKTGLVFTLRGDPVDVNGRSISPYPWLRWVNGAEDEQAVYKPPTKP